MTMSTARAFTTPLPGEDLAALAARCLPEHDPALALDLLRQWNLHLFARQPRGVILGADVVFTAPPQAAPAAS